MTWREYLETEIKAGATPELAQNTVGHLMDLYESWGWDDPIPFDPRERQ